MSRLKAYWSPATTLDSIDIPHWDVVLEEIFLIPPSGAGGCPSAPATLGELSERSGQSFEKVKDRVETIMSMGQGIEVGCQDLADDLSKGEGGLFLLDVRQPWEFELCYIKGSLLLCEVHVPELMDTLRRARRVVTICHHGVRSYSAAMFLREHGIQAESLKGGLDEWARVIDRDMQRY